jgi:hypothetical protein
VSPWNKLRAQDLKGIRYALPWAEGTELVQSLAWRLPLERGATYVGTIIFPIGHSAA